MSILIAHPGSQHVPHLVRNMLRANQDVEYYTTMMFGDGSSWQNFLPQSLFLKRKLNDIPDRVIHRQMLLEFVPAVSRRMGASEAEGYARRNRMFQNGIPSSAIKRSSAIIGFDTSSLILAQRAKDYGVPFFLELTTPHPREKQKWLQHILDNFPGWPMDALDKPAELIEREEREVELATVVSVPSVYVKKSHELYTGSRTNFVINPFGADLSAFHPKQVYSERPRFIFLGALNAAKGIPVLLKAWELANPEAELVVAGYGKLPGDLKLPKNVTVAGAVAKTDRLQFFHSADVLVCPSLYEGLAIVQLEAAACGLAVIGTHNSGGSEFLTAGTEGLFVAPGNANELAAAITHLCNDPALREKMGRAAAAKAQQYTWEAYAQRWLATIARSKK